MARYFSWIFPLLMFGSAYAEAPQDAPPQVGMVGVVIFVVIFFGLIVGFFWYYWWTEKKRQREKEHKS
jgi:membrane protein DedA with SNARE-associated domain